MEVTPKAADYIWINHEPEKEEYANYMSTMLL